MTTLEELMRKHDASILNTVLNAYNLGYQDCLKTKVDYLSAYSDGKEDAVKRLSELSDSLKSSESGDHFDGWHTTRDRPITKSVLFDTVKCSPLLILYYGNNKYEIGYYLIDFDVWRNTSDFDLPIPWNWSYFTPVHD